MLKKLILLAGPTASGKSNLAIKLAEKINGEIINADSMQVFKEFSVLSSRNLNKKTSGVVITEISNRSPLNNLLSVNDIIIEVQKSPVKTSSDLKRLVDNFFQKGEKTLLLTVINKNNQRRYLGVKIN